MTSGEKHAERSRDLERLLAFVDAIAAVAITLLILPLAELAGEIRHGGDVGELIRTHGGDFWSFFLSFAVIARLWLAQHEIVMPVIAANRRVVACLVLWSLAIVFLPFPTALLPESGEQALTRILYIGTIAVTATCLTVLAYEVARNRSLRDTDRGPSVLDSASVLGTLLAALAISLAAPSIGYYALTLVAFSGAFASVVRWLTGRLRSLRRDAGS